MKLIFDEYSFRRLTACVGRKYKTEDGEEKTNWQAIGVGFLNEGKNGKQSITVKLDALPVGGEFTLFEKLSKAADS